MSGGMATGGEYNRSCCEYSHISDDCALWVCSSSGGCVEYSIARSLCCQEKITPINSTWLWGRCVHQFPLSAKRFFESWFEGNVDLHLVFNLLINRQLDCGGSQRLQSADLSYHEALHHNFLLLVSDGGWVAAVLLVTISVSDHLCTERGGVSRASIINYCYNHDRRSLTWWALRFLIDLQTYLHLSQANILFSVVPSCLDVNGILMSWVFLMCDWQSCLVRNLSLQKLHCTFLLSFCELESTDSLWKYQSTHDSLVTHMHGTYTLPQHCQWDLPSLLKPRQFSCGFSSHAWSAWKYGWMWRCRSCTCLSQCCVCAPRAGIGW